MTGRPEPPRPRADARTEVLDRIRRAWAGAEPAAGEAAQVERRYRTTVAMAPAKLRTLFTARVTDYRATVRAVTAAELPEAVAEVLAGHGSRRVVVPPGLNRRWLAPWEATNGAEVVVDDPALTARDLDRVDTVVTGCAVAVAETGTLVLDASDDQGRRIISLVPDHHLCVVPADRLVASVPEAVARLDPHRPLTWISGPSATSDIELRRVEGVHGPRALDVLLLVPPRRTRRPPRT